jgi:hypothetical protein
LSGLLADRALTLASGVSKNSIEMNKCIAVANPVQVVGDEGEQDGWSVFSVTHAPPCSSLTSAPQFSLIKELKNITTATMGGPTGCLTRALLPQMD